MIATLSKETQQVLRMPELIIITKRVDDVALLLGHMIRMGLPKVLDKHIPQRGCQRVKQPGNLMDSLILSF